MKLYDFLVAPNPRRVRIFLAEKGIEIPMVQVNIPTGENLKPEFLREDAAVKDFFAPNHPVRRVPSAGKSS